MPQIQIDRPVLTPAEVATLFRVAPKTVSRWAKAGTLPTAYRTLGGHRRYYEDDVQARLRSEQPAPAPRHSIGVEPVTAELREHDRSLPDAATLAVVERSHGLAVKVCATDARDLHGVSMEDLAKSYAHTYGATYVPAVDQ